MLSATPVNNKFLDLKNQLALAYEGHTDYIDEKLNTSRSIDEIFKNAQRAFNAWSKWDPADRTTEKRKICIEALRKFKKGSDLCTV